MRIRVQGTDVQRLNGAVLGAHRGIAVLRPAEPGRFILIAGACPTDGGIRAIVLSETAVEQLSELPEGSWAAQALPAKIQIARLLAAEGARAAEVAVLLGQPRNVPEVWRWIALGRASPALQSAIDSRRLTLGHARPLLALPHAQQEDWVTRAVRGRWSVRQLTQQLAGGGTAPAAESSPDLAQLESQLSQQLGAGVRIDWAATTGEGRALRIEWFDIEALKGVLARLAEGPEQLHAPAGTARRELVIPVADATELGALTDHLLG